MATLTLDVKVRLVGDEETTDVPVAQKKVTYTAKEDKTYIIGAGLTETIWAPTVDSTEATSDFDFLFMKADGDLDVEMTVNEGDANEELNSFRLASGCAFSLGADDAYATHSASDIYAGALDVIDKIRVRNPGASPVELRIIMVT